MLSSQVAGRIRQAGSARGQPGRMPPRLAVRDGALEAGKWAALILMTLDHANAFLYDDALPVIPQLSRVVMPVFGFVLAYNLARPGASQRGVYRRVMLRLSVFAAIASLFYIPLIDLHPRIIAPAGAHLPIWYPLNILWLLLAATACIACLDRGRNSYTLLAIVVFSIAGALAEYFWFGLLYCIAVWKYCRQPSWSSLVLWLIALLGICLVNQNLWALASLPVILAGARIHVEVPRIRWAFYTYYPAHLAVLLAINRLILSR
jgi:TraX protein